MTGLMWCRIVMGMTAVSYTRGPVVSTLMANAAMSRTMTGTKPEAPHVNATLAQILVHASAMQGKAC